jgi:endonuclease-8
MAQDFDDAAAVEALRRLRDPSRAGLTIAEALLDQGAFAGIGNVYKSEVLFVEGVNPFRFVADLSDAVLAGLIETGRRLLLANRESGRRVTTGAEVADRRRTGSLWVYGRAGRTCRRCGRVVLDRRHGRLNRRTFWCPGCQADLRETS